MERIQSIAELQQSSRWFWVCCDGERCGHSSAMAIAPLVIRWGPETSPDILRRSARCTRCGRKRATLRHPSWASTIVGFEEFPGRARGTLSQRLTERLGKQFFVENIPGAGSNIGTGQAAKAAPDGHTMLVTTPSFVINPSFFNKVPYDPYKDFEAVALAVTSTNVLTVNSSVPATTVKELIALIRANPGKYNLFASTGGGQPSHLAAEGLRVSLGLDIVQVPYNGGGPATAAVIAGHVPIGIFALASAAPYIQAGNLHALAVMGDTRSQNLPSVPTIAEAGYPEIKGDSWVGVFLPARTPKEIVTLLNREIASIVIRTDTKDRLPELGFEPVLNTPEEFADRLKDDFEKWAKVIRAANIKPE